MFYLRYKCGSAREFLVGGNHVPDYTMTCLWDKSWQPSHKLPGPCDWVQCLKPPTPPASTNLRVTDWDSQPIPFGDPIRYVCKRGFQFEEDPAQEEQVYSCQDGTAPETVRGFFDVPQGEDEWPRCVRGKSYFTLSTKFATFCRTSLSQASRSSRGWNSGF